MTTKTKYLGIKTLTVLLLSASVMITHAASSEDEHDGHHQTGSSGENVAIAEMDFSATMEKEVVRERVRVGPRSKARFVWRTVEAEKPVIERQRAPGRNPVGPPSRSRGRNR